MENKLSYLSLAPHLKSLRYCGCYHLNAKALKRHKSFHTVYMRFVLLFVMTYTVQQIMKVYETREDLNRVMQTVLLMLTNSDSIFKQIVLWVRADKIDQLLNIMQGPIFNQGVQEHETLLRGTIKEALLVLRGTNYSALFTCLLWVVYPIILFIQGKPVEFAIWLPFDANMSPHFYAAIIYVWVQTSWLAFNNTSMDAFITFFLAQSRTQLSILRLDLVNIVEKSKEEAHRSSTQFSEVFRRRFQKILLHYNQIIEFAEITEKVFSGVIFYLFMVSGWIICTTAYRTVNINPASVEFISMICYMICVLIEIYIYCHYGQDVFWESEGIIESAYAMDWLELDNKDRKDVILFMERIKKPIAPKAGDLIPLSNSTYVQILRSSYSFYVFLKNTD